MKIVHLLNTNKYSGAENVVCQIISMFKNDANVEMIYCSFDGPIRQILEKEKIHFEPISKLTTKEIKRIIEENKPDIIHAHDFRASIISSLVGFKGKIIFHLHNNSPWIKKRGLYSKIFKYCSKKANYILTVSDSIRKEYVYSAYIEDKIEIISNPFNPSDIVEYAKEFEFNASFDIGYCGRLSNQKNPFLFVDIIKELKEKGLKINSVMIGEGELKDSVNEYISKQDLKNEIQMIGFKDNPFPIIKRFKVLLMPSKWEGFGLVAAEALSLGVPVVCGNVGGLPNIVNNSCGLLCDSKEEYTFELIKLLTNAEYYLQKKQNALIRSKELSNYDEYKKKLLSIYGVEKHYE